MRRRTAENIVKERAVPKGVAKNAKSEEEAFLLFFSDEMLNTIVTRTKTYMQKTRNRLEYVDSAMYDADITEMKALLGLLLFRRVPHDIQQPCEDLWHGTDIGRPIYRAITSYNRYLWLMKNVIFHNPETLRVIGYTRL